MKLKDATAIATEWVRKLRPYCERIDIAGSIRRQKPEVKDIEIVLQPKLIIQADLFGGKERVRPEGFIDCFRDPSILVKKGHAATSKYIQVHLSDHVLNIDVFIATPENYGLIMLIRTGDWEFSKKFLGTLLPWNGYKSEDGYLKKKDGSVIPVDDERQLFAFCKIPFIEPRNRNATAI